MIGSDDKHPTLPAHSNHLISSNNYTEQTMALMKSIVFLTVSCFFIGALSAPTEGTKYACGKKYQTRMSACFKGPKPAPNAKPTAAQSSCVSLVTDSIKTCIKGTQGANIRGPLPYDACVGLCIATQTACIASCLASGPLYPICAAACVGGGALCVNGC